MDIADPVQREHAVSSIGSVDVLINNAGYGCYCAVGDVSEEDAKGQFEVNVFGLAEMSKLVIPGMREQRRGRIINISSMGGRLVTPFGGWYHASKYAVEALSDALRVEVKPFGIDVVLVEPGGIKTNWGTITADNLEKSSAGGAYEEQVQRFVRIMRRTYGGSMLSKPEVVVKAPGEGGGVRKASHPLPGGAGCEAAGGAEDRAAG